MSDPLAITDEEAEGLARLAQVQLRLAVRLAERAEAADEMDDACRLARASERAARGYRQSLLVKAKLRRERDAARREAADPVPPRPQEQARKFKRQRELYEAVERVAVEALPDRDDLDFALQMAFEQIDAMMVEDEAFADTDLAAQVGRICEDVGVLDRAGPSAAADGPRRAGEAASSPDSS